jgi:hypothetical protein
MENEFDLLQQIMKKEEIETEISVDQVFFDQDQISL